MPTLIAQDDNGSVSNANTYVLVAFADSYHADINNISWASASDTDKEYALINAWQYIDFVKSPFNGNKRNYTVQNTMFPRVNLYFDYVLQSGIPVNVKYAQCEYALIALSQALISNPTYDSSGRWIEQESRTVGKISRSITYGAGGGFIINKAYPKADYYLSQFVTGSLGVVRG